MFTFHKNDLYHIRFHISRKWAVPRLLLFDSPRLLLLYSTRSVIVFFSFFFSFTPRSLYFPIRRALGILFLRLRFDRIVPGGSLNQIRAVITRVNLTKVYREEVFAFEKSPSHHAWDRYHATLDYSLRRRFDGFCDRSSHCVIFYTRFARAPRKCRNLSSREHDCEVPEFIVSQ